VLFYLDTSVLVASIFRERATDRVLAWLEKNAASCACSAWTVAELPSGFGIRVRQNLLSEMEASRLLREAQTWITSSLRVLSVADEDFQMAADLLAQWRLGLKAGDALHLSIARRLRMPLVSLDDRLNAAARSINLPLVEI
jgi:uncharacterized protein